MTPQYHNIPRNERYTCKSDCTQQSSSMVSKDHRYLISLRMSGGMPHRKILKVDLNSECKDSPIRILLACYLTFLCKNALAPLSSSVAMPLVGVIQLYKAQALKYKILFVQQNHFKPGERSFDCSIYFRSVYFCALIISYPRSFELLVDFSFFLSLSTLTLSQARKQKAKACSRCLPTAQEPKRKSLNKGDRCLRVKSALFVDLSL